MLDSGLVGEGALSETNVWPVEIWAYVRAGDSWHSSILIHADEKM